MSKAACVIMGLAFLALGILGLTGLVSIFQSDPVYVNIGEIVLGGLGFMIGVYSRQSSKQDRQKQENVQLKKENEQRIKDNADRQKQENERLKKKIE